MAKLEEVYKRKKIQLLLREKLHHQLSQPKSLLVRMERRQEDFKKKMILQQCPLRDRLPHPESQLNLLPMMELLQEVSKKKMMHQQLLL